MINSKQETEQNYETSDAIFLLRAKCKTGTISLKKEGSENLEGAMKV